MLELRQKHTFYGILLYIASTIFVLYLSMPGSPEANPCLLYTSRCVYEPDYAGHHFISYLPMDAPHHASQFIRIAQPSRALWVKYEYWYYFLRTLYRRNIPLLLVSGIFRPDQPFFNWYGKFWRRMLGFFTQLFVQDERSLALLQSIGVRHKVILAGDTRFDRVSAISDQWQSPAAFLSNFCLGHRVIVVGLSLIHI